MLKLIKKHWYIVPILSLLVILPVSYDNCRLKDKYSAIAGQAELLKKQRLETEERLLSQNNQLIDDINGRIVHINEQARAIIEIQDDRQGSLDEISRLRLVIATEAEDTALEDKIKNRDTFIVTLELDLSLANQMLQRIGIPNYVRRDDGTEAMSFPAGTLTAFLASQILDWKAVAENLEGLRIKDSEYIGTVERQVKILERKLGWNKTRNSALTLAAIGGIVYMIIRGLK